MKFRPFFEDIQGNFAVIFAVTLVPVTLGIGLAMDYSHAYRVESRMLEAAETAAIAGVKEFRASEKEREDVAHRLFDSNRERFGTINKLSTSVELTPTTATYSATAEVPTAMMGIANIPFTRASVSATAEIGIEPACMLVMSPNRSEAVKLQGSPSISTRDCYVHVNSSSREAAKGQGNPKNTHAEFCLVGGYSGKRWAPIPETGCDPIANPLAKLSNPAAGPCTQTRYQASRSGTDTLRPGHYCGGIRFGPQSQSFLQPGIYFISGGALNLANNAHVSGDGVVFILADDEAHFSFGSGGNWNVTPPTSGQYKGILFHQPPGLTPRYENEITGGKQITIRGVIHTPASDMILRGSPDLTLVADGPGLVANTLTLQGSPNMTVQYSKDPDMKLDTELVGRPGLIRVIR